MACLAMCCTFPRPSTRHAESAENSRADGRRADSCIYCGPHFPVAGGLSWNRIATNPSTHPARHDARGVGAEDAGDPGPSLPRARRTNQRPVPRKRCRPKTPRQSPKARPALLVRVGAGAGGAGSVARPRRISRPKASRRRRRQSSGRIQITTIGTVPRTAMTARNLWSPPSRALRATIRDSIAHADAGAVGAVVAHR